MDEIQDFLSQFTASHNTTTTTALLNNAQSLFRLSTRLNSYTQSYAWPFLTQLTSAASSKPDLATLALVVVILFLSLKMLNMLFRTVFFWIRLAWRLVFWGSIILAGFWIWNRGLDDAMGDAIGWARQGVRVWNQEYDYWKERAEQAQLGQQGHSRQQYGNGRGQGGRGWF